MTKKKSRPDAPTSERLTNKGRCRVPTSRTMIPDSRQRVKRQRRRYEVHIRSEHDERVSLCGVVISKNGGPLVRHATECHTCMAIHRRKSGHGFVEVGSIVVKRVA